MQMLFLAAIAELAIAPDGDNTVGRAAFSNIHFVGRDQPCVA